MYKWTINVFEGNGKLKKEFVSDRDAKQARSYINGKKIHNANVREAVDIYSRPIQRIVLESLLICEDCTIDEVIELTGISKTTIQKYKNIFFRIDQAFNTRLDVLDYIESGIADNSDDPILLENFLMKRWARSLGKEFVIWRYRLKPVTYTPATLYDTVIKEAFFYHKEKSMGNNEISLQEYLRSANSILSGIKNGSTIAEVSKEDNGLDILEQLDIIIEDTEAIPAELPDADILINNAIEQENI
jgi:hypothetical protein